MMTQIMVARFAPVPSSPAQGRAAARLRGSDSPIVVILPSEGWRSYTPWLIRCFLTCELRFKDA